MRTKSGGWRGSQRARGLTLLEVMLATSLIVCYGYFSEAFFAWYTAEEYEQFMMYNRMFGPYLWGYWGLILCNVLVPQIMWFKKARTSAFWLFFASQFVNVGMWLERYVIVAMTLTRDFLVSSWGTYHGTIWDWAVYIGTFGLFISLLFVFIRLLPALSMTELKMISPEGKTAGDH